MTATAKYLFDEDFSSGEKRRPSPWSRPAPARGRQWQAYRNGFAAGQVQAQNAALAVIADGMERLHKALAVIEARLESETVEVAVAVAGKLAPELIAREPFAEISTLATESFSHLVKAPHVVVHIGADAYEPTKGSLTNRRGARLRGPTGGIVRCGHGARRLPHRMGRWRHRPRPRRDPLPSSTTSSPATWRRAPAPPIIRNSGDRRDE